MRLIAALEGVEGTICKYEIVVFSEDKYSIEVEQDRMTVAS